MHKDVSINININININIKRKVSVVPLDTAQARRSFPSLRSAAFCHGVLAPATRSRLCTE